MGKGEKLVHGPKIITWCKDNLDIPLCGWHATVDEMGENQCQCGAMLSNRLLKQTYNHIAKFHIKAFVLYWRPTIIALISISNGYT